MFEYQKILAHDSYLDREIRRLARNNNIPREIIDDRNVILRDFEEEIKKLEEVETENKKEISKEVINQLIKDYKEANPFTEEDPEKRKEKKALFKEFFQPTCFLL